MEKRADAKKTIHSLQIAGLKPQSLVELLKNPRLIDVGPGSFQSDSDSELGKFCSVFKGFRPNRSLFHAESNLLPTAANCHVLVARLLKFYESKDIKLQEVAHIAIDEAATPSSGGFGGACAAQPMTSNHD